MRSRSAATTQAERQLAAVVAADIVGYSRLMGADEEGTLARLKACRRELIDPGIAGHRGRIVKTTGDGLLVEFSSPVEAVCWAVETQQGMIERNANISDDRRIYFRVGINLGDVIVDDKDLFGDAVNIAARLENLADPGGICISRTVREQVRDRLALPFADGGEQSVKNIARPIRVYALSAAAVAALPRAEAPPPARPARRFYQGRNIAAAALGAVLIRAGGVWELLPSAKTPLAVFALAGVLTISGGVWRLWPSEKALPAIATAPPPAVAANPPTSQAVAKPRLSIVVLPFANLSDDREQQYFAYGVTEDLTTDLSRMSDSFVISRNTAFTYKGKPADAKQIGRELGVRYVLEGSVRRSGNKIRVNAQLIDAETGAHLWAERFDYDIGALFALQNEITSRIAIALNVALVRAEAARPTASSDALDYLFQARAARLRSPSADNSAKIIGLLEQALALDPGSAEVRTQLAFSLSGRVLLEMSNNRAADLARAEELLELSPDTALGHWAKGQVLRAQRRYADSIPEYEAAIALDRNLPAAYVNLGMSKLLTGSVEETIPLIEQAIRLSPRDPDPGAWYDWIGLTHLLQSRTDEAIVWLEKARSASPARPFTHARLAAAYGIKGEVERAAAELAEARRLSGEPASYPSIAGIRASSGRKAMAPKTRALFEATYDSGLRKAGVPEE